MRKATHIGSCQCCGSIQKLPGGMLSKHGYHVRWGCFDGICRGTEVLPYERSCNLIKSFIEEAQKRKADEEAYIASLLQPATEPRGWWHQYIIGDSRQSRSGYKWIQVELRQVKNHAGGGECTERVYVDHQGKEQDLYQHGYCGGEKSLLAIATDLNARYVEQALRPRVKELERYIFWQQRRISDWKLADLQPVPPEALKDPDRKPGKRRSWR